MISVGKWDFMITQENDDDWQWVLTYEYNNEYTAQSKSFKTFKACQKNAIKQMKKMNMQFTKLIAKAAKEKE